MKVIEALLSILRTKDEINDKLQKIGILSKKIGSTYYIKATIKGLEAVSITINNDEVSNIGLTLNENYNIKQLSEELNVLPVVRDNNYDSVKVFSYKMPDYLIIVKKDSSNIEKSQENFTFKELDIRLNPVDAGL